MDPAAGAAAAGMYPPVVSWLLLAWHVVHCEQVVCSHAVPDRLILTLSENVRAVMKHAWCMPLYIVFQSLVFVLMCSMLTWGAVRSFAACRSCL